AQQSPGSTEPAQSKESSSAMPSVGPPAPLISTRTARGSTKPTCRCRWCWSRGMAACTASAPSTRPQTGSSCELLVSDAMASPALWPGMPLTVPLSPPEPLSEPEIVGNSSVKAGGNTKLVCRVLEGTADLFWWKKNGELLLESERIQFVNNSTLHIIGASIDDSGYYTCVVSNAVSQNETSFLLHIHSEWPFLPQKPWEQPQKRDPLS
ncbi:HMCN1 protein, partial [Neodrepanis coruscans]|nr:HMCN1 protein [Neodrepanis coruscans]